MVVWGGVLWDESSEDWLGLDTGGRYEPATDVWLPTATTGAPSPRWSHAAVWLGGRMVVWGGKVEGPTQEVALGTGGRYDPLTDAWLPTSALDAPLARYQHAAVSSGDAMVIWGGRLWERLKTGGRYSLGHAQDDDGDGLSECDGDCNDASADTFPGAIERCDGADNDCDGTVDLDAVTPDADLDGIADCLDNCPSIPNEDQANTDDDAAGDLCDCAPSAGGAFATPPEVTGVRWRGWRKEDMFWDSALPLAGEESVYDVIRGLVAELPVGGGASETCLATDLAEETVSDSSAPATGACFYYLVRARNTCGVGTDGETSGGAPRTSDACAP
jgi:hypothetical protein